MLIIKNYSSNYKMVIESLKIKTKTNYNWDDIVYVYDVDVKLIKVIKRESKLVLIFIILDTYLILNMNLTV